MNRFRHKFVHIGEGGFNSFSSGSDKIFSRWIVLTFGIGFPGCRQTYTVIPEHVFEQITGISGISDEFAAFGKVPGQPNHSVGVMSAACSKATFYRYTFGCYSNVHLKAEKIFAFGGAVSPVFISPEYPASGDTDVPANGYRKTVSTIRGTDVQRLYRFAGIREESGQQACYTVQPAIEPAFTQHVWNQPVLTDKNDGSFCIAAKIFCGNQCDCYNFAIGYCTVLCFFMMHGFKHIIKKYVYCNGFYNCGHSVCFYASG